MNDRRVTDPIIEQLVADVNTLKSQHAEIKKDIGENTKLTKEVRDLLKAFKLVGHFAKWTTYLSGAAAGIITLYHQVKGS